MRVSSTISSRPSKSVTSTSRNDTAPRSSMLMSRMFGNVLSVQSVEVQSA